jgi:glycosyltransferase involved in cell wall biosynthesis
MRKKDSFANNLPAKASVIALIQLPPPLHGAAVVNREVVTSEVLNEVFRIVVVPIQLSFSLTNIGTLDLGKFLIVIKNAIKMVATLWIDRYAFVYFTIPPHSGGFYANLPLVLITKLFRTPLLYHFHGKGIRMSAEKSVLYRRLFAWAMEGAHVIFLSERLYEDAADFVPKDRAFYLPNALVSPLLPDDSLRDGHHILFLSNLVITKGPIIVLDALALLKQRGIPFRASFAGAPTGSLSREKFEAAFRARHLEDVVRYLGQVDGKQKEALINSADILAFPTYKDAFPLVILEAMGAGLAVVATPEGAIPDIVRDGETGLIVPHHNPEKLADALQRLLEDREMCQRMGRKGWEVVTCDYSYDAYHQRIKDIWNLMIDKK